MKKKISLLLIAIMLSSLVLTACGNGEPADVDKPEDNVEEDQVKDDAGETNTLDSIIERGTIVLGTDADYPPFEFHTMVDGKDEIVGLDIEIAKYIADELGVELEIQEMDFDKLLGGLATEKLDMVIAGMNPSPERLEEADFSDIYYEANLGVLVKKDSDVEINNQEDLDGKTIGVQMGTVQEEIAQETINDAEVTSLGKNPDIIMNLKTGKVDCAIVEVPVAESFARANDDIKVVEGLEIDNDSEGVAIATKKGNDQLTEKMNEILEDIKSQGLIEKWLVEADELSTKDI